MPPSENTTPAALPLTEGMNLYLSGRLQAAEAFYRAFLDRQPEHPEALHMLGVVSYSLSRFDAACELMARADRLQPATSTVPLCDYAIALAATERYQEVIDVCRRTLAIDPGMYQAYGRMGDALQRLGRIEEALACYNTALRLQPAYGDGYYYLGSALLQLGYREEAVVAFREAQRLGPETARVTTLLGNAFNSLGFRDEATATYKAALAWIRGMEYSANPDRRQSNAVLRRLCAPCTGRVLSIGSANDSDKEGGIYREYFANAAAYFRLDCNRHVLPDIVGDLQDLRQAIPDRAYGAVLCIWVLEHVADVRGALAEIHRILEPGGAFIFCLPLNVAFHSFPHDYHRFTRDGIQDLCRNLFLIEEIHAVGEETPFALDPRLALIGDAGPRAHHSHVGLCRAI